MSIRLERLGDLNISIKHRDFSQDFSNIIELLSMINLALFNI